MPAGRPPKYETKEELQKVIDLYFLVCQVRETGDITLIEGLTEEEHQIINDNPSNKPTVSGLAYALGMTRKTLCEYEKDDEFSNTIKRAKQRIEIYLEESLSNNACAGTIFNLKNNFKWKDKHEQEISGPNGNPQEHKWIIEVVEADVKDEIK